MDAVIVGGTDTDHINLRSLAHCSGISPSLPLFTSSISSLLSFVHLLFIYIYLGGISVRIPQQEASLVSVFEREQILALSARIPRPVLAKDKLTLDVSTNFSPLAFLFVSFFYK